METITHKQRTHPSGLTTFDDPVHRMASEIGRQEITMASAAKAECMVYMLVPEDIEYGLDPWRYLDGIYPYVDGSLYDIWTQGGHCITVKPDQDRFRFFVDQRFCQ